MVKQVAVRTFPYGWTNNMTQLQKLLDGGYKVVNITPLPDGIIEYIMEKQVKDEE